VTLDRRTLIFNNRTTIMFDRLRHRLRGVGTLKTLCEAAEQHARRAGQDQPGAEHFVLAALDLPDGSARDCRLEALRRRKPPPRRPSSSSAAVVPMTQRQRCKSK
jgi:hypothetical protein